MGDSFERVKARELTAGLATQAAFIVEKEKFLCHFPRFLWDQTDEDKFPRCKNQSTSMKP